MPCFCICFWRCFKNRLTEKNAEILKKILYYISSADNQVNEQKLAYGENSVLSKRSRVTLVENGMLPPNTNTETFFLKSRAPFKQASFNVRTLMQTRQQINLAVFRKS
ncbi:unnamed protein product [Schistosoma rodhaini]|nr:unnamed protein product [Schistosoma rodhaini]